MIKYSILLTTYNRHRLVIQTLRSVLAQTYTNFEVLLVDNGSNPPVYDALKDFSDSRIKFMRYEENRNINEVCEEALNQIAGTHFIWLADDDVLTPSALEIVASVFESHNNMDILVVRLAYFRHGTDLQPGICIYPNALQSVSGRLEEFDGEEAGLRYFNYWGIGAKQNYRGPQMPNPSGVFLSKKLIDITRKRQRELFIKPLGDVGYVGAFFNVKEVYFLDLPLSVVGDHPGRGVVGMNPGMRRKWDEWDKSLEHTPIRGTSFTNMATDSCLKVLYRNGLDKKYDCRLRPDFYHRHLAQILSDSPWTKATVKDLVECLPYLIVSHYRFFSVRNTIKGLFQLPLPIGRKIFGKAKGKIFSPPNRKPQGIEFENIYEFAVWLDYNYVKPNRRNLD